MSDENQYVSPIPRRVTTLSGHILVFKANEPRFVPPVAQPEMLELGILPVNGKPPKAVVPEKEDEPRPDPVGLERRNKLEAAFGQLIDKNDPDDFNATGLPKVAVVSKIVGFTVTAKELGSEWKNFQSDAE